MTRLWFSSALLPTGWADAVRLTVSDGLITNVEVGVAPEADRHGPAIPGLANVHSHTFQRAMAGLTERRGPTDDDFWTWREQMYRFVDRLGPDDVKAVAEMAFVEMLETGFTRVGEFHYLHHDPTGTPYTNPAELATRIVAAASTTGIGLTLLPVFYAHANFGGRPPTPGQRRFVTTLDDYARLLENCCTLGVSVGVAPHSLRAVTPDELRAVVALAAPTEPVHIHVSEQTREVDDCLAWCGQRPVEWLLANQPLDARWCLIHATHTTPTERAGIVASSAVVGLCPITEANLGDGVFAANSFAGRFGIGTDSNVLIDAAGELRQLEYAQRLTVRRRNVLASDPFPSTGRALFEAASRGGSQALGSAGGLSLGQPADIVSLSPSAFGGDRLLDAWVFAPRTVAVESVWCRGRRVVVAGRHVARDVVERRYRTVLDNCS